MRSCFVVSCAAVMVLLLLGTGGASSPMDSVVWQTPYDNFSGSSLNTALWTVESSNGTLSTGAGGLTLTPTSLSGWARTMLPSRRNSSSTVEPSSRHWSRSLLQRRGRERRPRRFGLSLQSNDYSSDEYSSWFNANNFAAEWEHL